MLLPTLTLLCSSETLRLFLEDTLWGERSEVVKEKLPVPLRPHSMKYLNSEHSSTGQNAAFLVPTFPWEQYVSKWKIYDALLLTVVPLLGPQRLYYLMHSSTIRIRMNEKSTFFCPFVKQKSDCEEGICQCSEGLEPSFKYRWSSTLIGEANLNWKKTSPRDSYFHNNAWHSIKSD